MKPAALIFGCQISTNLVWSTLDSGIDVHMQVFFVGRLDALCIAKGRVLTDVLMCVDYPHLVVYVGDYQGLCNLGRALIHVFNIPSPMEGYLSWGCLSKKLEFLTPYQYK